ncbi:MAG: glycosyltransferase family 39 protein [Candidatus Altiarchaeota archaeon]
MARTLEIRLKDWHIILALILLSLAVRVAYIYPFTQPANYVVSDMVFYDGHADDLLNNRKSWAPTFWPPSYYIFLSWVYYVLKALGLYGQKYMLLPFVHALMSCLSPFFIYRITEKIASRKAAITACLIYAVFYPLIYLNVFILSENLFLPLLAASLYIIVCKLDAGKKTWFVISGLTLSLAAVTRPPLILFTPLFLAWHYHYNKGGLKGLALFLAAFMAVLSLHSLYSYEVTGGKSLSISTNGGPNFVLTWCDLREIGYRTNTEFAHFISPGNIDYPESRKVITNVQFTNQTYYYLMGLDCIKKNPSRIVSNIKQIFKVFHSYLFPRFSSVTGYETLFLIFKLFTYGMLIPLSLISFMYVAKENRKHVILLLLLVASLLIVVYVQAVGEERYLIPYEVAFIILGSVGFWGLVNKPPKQYAAGASYIRQILGRIRLTRPKAPRRSGRKKAKTSS